MTAKPIQFPRSKTDQWDFSEKLLKNADDILSKIPFLSNALSWFKTGIDALKKLGINLDISGEREKVAETWKFVLDNNSFNWRNAHTMQRNILQQKIDGLNRELNEIIPNKTAQGDRVAKRFALPYAFLLTEYERIKTENFGSTILGSITPQKASTGIGLAAIGFFLYKSFK